MAIMGQLLGLLISGVLSDRYGRKRVAVSFVLWCGTFGFLRACFSSSFTLLTAFEFLYSFFSAPVYGISFIWAFELMNKARRPLAISIIALCYPMGGMAIGLLAWYSKNCWYHLLMLSHAPVPLFAFYYKKGVIPESEIWASDNGHRSDISLETTSHPDDGMNGERSQHESDSNGNDDSVNPQDEANNEVQKQPNCTPKRLEKLSKLFCGPIYVTNTFPSKESVLIVFYMGLVWLMNGFMYFGLSTNAIDFLEDTYFNYILTNAMEIPAAVLTGFILKNPDRDLRTLLSITFFLSSIMCISSEYIPTDWQIMGVIIVLIRKSLIVVSFNVTCFYTCLMFQTQSRSFLFGLTAIFGRVGYLIAPKTILLGKRLGKYTPILLFCTISIISEFSRILLPNIGNENLTAKTNDEQKCEKQEQDCSESV